MMIFVFVVTVIVLIAGIILTIFSPCFDTNIASMLGGLLSALSTVLLGTIAILQNKKYKQLSDESNKRTEQMMFTPEFHVQMIHDQSYDHEISEIIYTPNDATYAHKTSIVCAVLNLPMINIKVKKIDFLANNDTVKSYEEKELLTNIVNGISIVIPNTSFSLRIGIPSEYFNEKYECRVQLQYQKIYQSKIGKEIVIKKLPRVDEFKVIKIGKATLCDAQS